ncbi:MAG TPA: energy-coupling factor ABC transporter permease [Bryobacteraceae bacterium]|jgi:cobalt/nickel transport system permease protein
MHIPDGFLSPPVWATLDAVSLTAVGLIARRAQRDTEESIVPLLGVMGAFVFAAQMINFPVGLGTSGHLVGGALLAMVLGPAAATVVMTAILVIQAFVFQDGGVMSLGANIFNMALAGVFAGYLPYRYWAASPRARKAAIFAGGTLSVLVSACFALAQLAISGVPLRRWLPVSLVLFLVSALLEGAITVAAVSAIERLNAAWVRRPITTASRPVGIIAIAAILLVTAGVLVATAAPDGIEKLAAQIGIAAHSPTWLHAPLADYEWQGLQSSWLRKASAGFTGMALLYGACLITGRFLSRQRSS